MKRLFIFSLLSALTFSNVASAQATDGGIPWSVTEQQKGNFTNEIPLVTLPQPNFAKAIEEDKTPSNGPYRYGLMVDANIDMNNSGKLIYLSNGRKVWTVKIVVPEAKATSLNYSVLNLPDGVNLFLKNGNGKQIVGAINKKYNEAGGAYSTTFIQGAEVIVELDMDPNVTLEKVGLHINKIDAVYRGGFESALNEDFGDNAVGINAVPTPLDASDPCHVNAICEPEGSVYANLRHTAASVYMNGYVCSGNLINNTSQDCTPLFLMASHCEQTNATGASPYNTWKFYFNYEYPLCTNNTVSASSLMNDYITGAKLKARSYYDPNSPAIVGDFILLELKDALNRLGNEYNAYLAGWDRSTSPPTTGKFIDFHHPAGDPKKVTVFSTMQGNGIFNGGAPGSHWKLSVLDKGGIEGGSSGSGIFAEANGRLYGDLSGGPDTGSPCDDPNSPVPSQNYSVYSKLYLNWEYTSGGDNTSATRLKDWLDPTGTDAMFTNTIKVADSNSTCGDDVSILNVTDFDNSVFIYPNPSLGLVTIKVNLTRPQALNIEIFDILGRKIQNLQVGKLASNEIKVDLSQYPSGVYLFKIGNDSVNISRRVVINK